MTMLKRFVKRYPLQSLLFLFNMGVFSWLQPMGDRVATFLGPSTDAVGLQIPQWVKLLVSDSLSQLQNFYSTTGWTWLVSSMVFTFLLSFVKGALKLVLTGIIIVLGLGLLYYYYHLLHQVKPS